MPRLIDLTGQRVGQMEVLSYKGGGKWECRCDCGRVVLVNGRGLRAGQTRVCSRLRHAHRSYDRHPYTYQAWARAKARKLLVPEWAEKFETFFEAVGERPERTRLVRLDKTKPLGPGNWEWRPIKEAR